MPDAIDVQMSWEAVYLSAPIPRNLAVLTVLGTVFDKVYFPRVYIPADGYDEPELDKEIRRLEALDSAQNYDTQVLIGVLKVTKFAKTLNGFCEFTLKKDDGFAGDDKETGQLVRMLYDAMHPPRPDFIPSFQTNYSKALPGGEEVAYPGDLHYLAGAILESRAMGLPLVNDVPGIPIPGIEQVPENNAKLLSTMLAIEATQLVMPNTPVFRPQDLMEFREANASLLRPFRRSMFRYAKDLNGKIAGMSFEDFEKHTQFFLETEIVPVLDELQASINDPRRSWTKRSIDALKIGASVTGALFTTGPQGALMKLGSGIASQVFTELSAHGDKQEAIKRAGLTYLLKLRAAQRA